MLPGNEKKNKENPKNEIFSVSFEHKISLRDVEEIDMIGSPAACCLHTFSLVWVKCFQSIYPSINPSGVCSIFERWRSLCAENAPRTTATTHPPSRASFLIFYFMILKCFLARAVGPTPMAKVSVGLG
jgi:hypothetical protein